MASEVLGVGGKVVSKEFLATALRARCRFAPSCGSVFWCSDLSSLPLASYDARWSVEIGGACLDGRWTAGFSNESRRELRSPLQVVVRVAIARDGKDGAINFELL